MVLVSTMLQTQDSHNTYTLHKDDSTCLQNLLGVPGLGFSLGFPCAQRISILLDLQLVHLSLTRFSKTHLVL